MNWLTLLMTKVGFHSKQFTFQRMTNNRILLLLNDLIKNVLKHDVAENAVIFHTFIQRQGIRQGWKPASLVEELLCGGLQEADAVHGGAVRKLQHQQGVSEWETHPGREHRRQRWTQGRLQGLMSDRKHISNLEYFLYVVKTQENMAFCRRCKRTIKCWCKRAFRLLWKVQTTFLQRRCPIARLQGQKTITQIWH